MDVQRFDVAVIGAGTAGLEAWRAAEAQGARAVLIEAGPWGTTCIRVGCIPSKLLLAAGDAARRAREAAGFGVHVGEPRVDGRAVMARVRSERDHFLSVAMEKVDAMPADRKLQGRARFTSAGRLDVDGRAVEADAVVIATGARPQVSKPLQGVGERLLTTDTLFDLEDLPASLAVAGAGSLGIELALAMARLGVEVCVFDKSPTVAGLHDPDVSARAAEFYRAELELITEVEVEAEAAGDEAVVRWTGDGGSGERTFARLLCASGRTPNVDGLGLETTGLKLDEDGVPEHDPATGRCGESGVYIAGDADDDRPVLHEAAFQGRTAGANAARRAADPGPRRPAFALTFTDPDAAVVGEPLRSLGDDAVTACFDEGRGRARMDGRPNGMVKLWARRGGGPVVGGEMVGPGVEGVAQLLAQIVAAKMTPAQALELPFYHPTYAEDLKAALEALDGALSKA